MTIVKSAVDVISCSVGYNRRLDLVTKYKANATSVRDGMDIGTAKTNF
mgnify:CR=1 FL=1